DVATEQPVPALPHVTPDATCQWHPAEFVTLVVHECYRIVWRGIVASATSLNPTTTKVLDCAAWNPPIRRCHYPGPWPYARSMTTADDPHPRREQEPRRERLRRRAATISGVTTSLLLTMAVGGTIASDTGRALLPGWLSSFGVALGFVVTVAIIWRHQYPGLLTGFALLPPVLAGPSLPALIALAALAASRRDRYLWLATGGVFVTTAWTLWLDTQRSVPGSVLQLPFGAQEGGPPVDVPVIAPVLFAVLLTGI